MGAKTRKLSQINDSLIEWQSVVVADGSTGLTEGLSTVGQVNAVVWPTKPTE